MFSYYGSKSKIVDYYPPPKYGKIIEPFAGSARYSLKWFDRDVLLVDKYSVIVDVWHYLQAASKQDILGLPNIQKGESIPASLSEIEKKFLGFLVVGGAARPQSKTTSFDGVNVGRDLRRIAVNLFKVRHWKIVYGDYREIENQACTWFIDPPYQHGGEHYHISNKQIDFSSLSKWCLARLGQVIVCENTKAVWLPFRRMTEMNGQMYETTEAIWTNYRTHYDAEQLRMFA